MRAVYLRCSVRLDFARARARYLRTSSTSCIFIAGSAAEGATSLEIQTATFIAAAKSSVVEILSDNDRRCCLASSGL